MQGSVEETAPRVRTVLGDVPAASVGRVLCHEHLFMTSGWPVTHEPDWRLDDEVAARSEVDDVQQAGAGCLVEMSPLGFGRSPLRLAALSEQSGIHIVATTGFHKASHYSDAHWAKHYSAEEIADLFVREIQVGTDEANLAGPLPRWTGVRAGIIKVATEYHSFGRNGSRVLDSAALAALRTGVPIGTHNDKGTMGHELLDEFEKRGLPAHRVLLGHIDHNPDSGYHVELAARGAYLIFDRPGLVRDGTDEDVIRLVERVVASGHGDRLLFGTDTARRSFWPSLGGGPGMAWILRRFVPRLVQMGLGAAAEAALSTNAQRALALSEPCEAPHGDATATTSTTRDTGSEETKQ